MPAIPSASSAALFASRSLTLPPITPPIRSALRPDAVAAQRIADQINTPPSMSSQDNGLSADDALVATAQGALGHLRDTLGRMHELASAAANGSNNTAEDRAQMEKDWASAKDDLQKVMTVHYKENSLFDSSANTGPQTTFGSTVLSSTASAAEKIKGLAGLSLTSASSDNTNDTIVRLNDALSTIDQSRSNIAALSEQNRPSSAPTPLSPSAPSVVDQSSEQDSDLQARLADLNARAKEMQERMESANTGMRARMQDSPLAALRAGYFVNTQA